MVEKTAAFRQRRAADTARWRERLQRGAAVYPVEVDGTTFANWLTNSFASKSKSLSRSKHRPSSQQGMRLPRFRS